MCRHLAYLGPPVTLESLTLEPEFSLLRQSWAPRHQAEGRLNADGFGVGWFDPSRSDPARYRRAMPMWTDRTFASIAGVIRSGAVLAAVRSASPGFPVEESGNAPFVDGRWLFSLNGLVHGWHEGVGAGLRAALPAGRLAALEGVVDSEVLFHHVLARMDDGAPAAAALGAVVADVLSRTTARLNLLLTNGESIVATTCGNSLFALRSDRSVLVASEPHDHDPRWEPISDASVIEATATDLTIRPLPAPGGR
jgi:glutamine amidotransferase